MQTSAIAIVLTACSLIGAHAFVPTSFQPSRPISFLRQNADGSNYEGGTFGGNGKGGGLEEIEFTIYPDGRVTSVVRGVKGARCQEITKPFHDAIGTVIDSTPTEDMFEQELVVDEKVVQRIDGQWDGTSSW